jgi:exosortase A-associated hydrolase 1
MNATSGAAQAIAFDCEGVRLQGVLHTGAPRAANGVLVVVGGPQYRVGSHRQFVLLGRALAARGIPVLRFDYRGLGDSAGEARTFEAIDADIRAALDEFFRRAPGLRRVAIWGLCDAASAALFYAASDPRVAGLVLLNPWVRTEQTVAQAYLRSYYARRILDPQAWRQLLFGAGKSPRAALRSFAQLLRHARGARATDSATPTTAGVASASPLLQRMQRGFAAFRGPVLLVLSGDDITAAEFRTASASRAWRRLLGESRVSHCELEAADHTFSSRAWRDQVAAWTGEWLERHWPASRDSSVA